MLPKYHLDQETFIRTSIQKSSIQVSLTLSIFRIFALMDMLLHTFGTLMAKSQIFFLLKPMPLYHRLEIENGSKLNPSDCTYPNRRNTYLLINITTL
ncbi:hypothetical protein O3Q51_12435 [Cryomorphaceae bacterium 1068]|nr:hypothetical protein [Cryomorphaceae bacterium 1068]